MIFYFDRDTGRRVSKSTWTRSKAHGGSRYVRRGGASTPKESTPTGKAAVAPSSPVSLSSQGAYTPSEVPRTWQEFQKRQADIEKRRRKNYDFNYEEGPEYDTGVDY